MPHLLTQMVMTSLLMHFTPPFYLVLQNEKPEKIAANAPLFWKWIRTNHFLKTGGQQKCLLIQENILALDRRCRRICLARYRVGRHGHLYSPCNWR
jgi:hypothetical protein